MSFRGERKKLDLGNYSLVIMEAFGKKFEIIVEPRKVIDFYKGKANEEEAIVLYEVFHDAQKGVKASIDDLRKLVLRAAKEKLEEKSGHVLSREEFEKIKREVEELEEENLKELATKYILRKGELKLPKELRDELLEKKEKQIIAYIQKYAINPATKAPYTPQKISDALKTLFSGQKIGERKIRIMLDPLKDIDEELPSIIEALKAIIPIRLEIIVVKVLIPPQFSGLAYGQLTKFGNVIESKWLDDGSLEAIVEVPGGEFLHFHRKLLDATKGSLKLEIIERKKIG